MRKFFQARSAHALTPPRDARAQPTRPRQREARDPGAGGGGRVRGRSARASRAARAHAGRPSSGPGGALKCTRSLLRAARSRTSGVTPPASALALALPARHGQEGQLLARQACAALHRSGTAKAMKPEAPRSAGGGVAGGPVSPSMSRARRARVGDKDHIHGTVCATWFSSHLSPPARHPFRSRRRSSFLPLCSHGILDSSSARPARNATGDRPSGPAASFPCSVHFGSAIALGGQRRPTRSF